MVSSSYFFFSHMTMYGVAQIILPQERGVARRECTARCRTAASASGPASTSQVPIFSRGINEEHQNRHIPTYSPRSTGHSPNIQTGVSEIPFHIVWQRARPIRPSGTWEVQQRHGDCTCGGAGQEGAPTKAPCLFHAFPHQKPLRTRSVMGHFAQE